MMKNFISFVLGAILLISCSGRNTVPSDILSQKNMQEVLWDVMRAQALSAEWARKDSSVSEVVQTKMLTQRVFEIHHITSSVFDESYAWYTGHPAMMRMMFDSMSTQNQRQNELRMKSGYKPFIKDSLKKAHR